MKEGMEKHMKNDISSCLSNLLDSRNSREREAVRY